METLYRNMTSTEDFGLYILVGVILIAFAVICLTLWWLYFRKPSARRMAKARRRYLVKRQKKAAKRQARELRKMVADGRIASMSSRQQAHPRSKRNWGEEARKKFSGSTESDPETTSGAGEETREMEAVGRKAGVTATV